jgi:hypothetical protein
MPDANINSIPSVKQIAGGCDQRFGAEPAVEADIEAEAMATDDAERGAIVGRYCAFSYG